MIIHPIPAKDAEQLNRLRSEIIRLNFEKQNLERKVMEAAIKDCRELGEKGTPGPVFTEDFRYIFRQRFQ